MDMDDTDHRLIALLRDNARLPVASLASILGVSRGTVQNRLTRLLNAGAIAGFTVKLRQDAKPAKVRAIMMVGIEGERTDTILKALRGFPEVVTAHTTNGRWDLVVELETESLESFDKALRQIRRIRGIASSETSILLSTFPA
jgi:DNA-binding Lrp family transcriptional regulator